MRALSEFRSFINLVIKKTRNTQSTLRAMYGIADPEDHPLVISLNSGGFIRDPIDDPKTLAIYHSSLLSNIKARDDHIGELNSTLEAMILADRNPLVYGIKTGTIRFLIESLKEQQILLESRAA